MLNCHIWGYWLLYANFVRSKRIPKALRENREVYEVASLSVLHKFNSPRYTKLYLNINMYVWIIEMSSLLIVWRQMRVNLTNLRWLMMIKTDRLSAQKLRNYFTELCKVSQLWSSSLTIGHVSVTKYWEMKTKGEGRDNFNIHRTSDLVGIKARQGIREGGRDGRRKREGESAQESESTNHYSISAAVITLLWRTDAQDKSYASHHLVLLEIYHPGMVPYSLLVKAISTKCISHNNSNTTNAILQQILK